MPSRRIVPSPLAGRRVTSAAYRWLYKTQAWRDESRRFLDERPLCAEHERRGELREATCVDHVVPHRGDVALFWDRSNWQPLCQSCHSSKTARGE